MKKIDTTLNLINSHVNTAGYSSGVIIETLGYSSTGGSGGSRWMSTGNAITASQDPLTLNDIKMSDASGNEFQLVIEESGIIDLNVLGGVGAGYINIANAANLTYSQGLTSNPDVSDRPINVATIAIMTARVGVSIGEVFISAEFSTGNGGGGTYDAVLTSSVTPNAANIIIGVADPLISFVLRVGAKADFSQFGGINDDSNDNSTLFGVWVDYLIANNIEGEAFGGVFRLDTTITRAIATGLTLSGDATFKAGGSQREDMIVFDGCKGDVKLLGGLTFDGNNLVSKIVNIENESTAPSDIADIEVSEGVSFINALNITGNTFFTVGLAIQGGFNKIHFNGLIDGIDDQRTAGAQTSGLNVVEFAGADDYCRHLVIGSKARIRNIKNDNTVVADADGVKHRATNTLDEATLTVTPGASFEECEGRAVKAQVPNVNVIGARIHRSLYDGQVEIDCQYAGGIVADNIIIHDGVRVNEIVRVSQRLVPAISTCKVTNNKLVILSAGVTDTESFLLTIVTDAAVKCAGIVFENNSVTGGAIDYIVKSRCSAVTGNEIVVTNNHAETVNTSYVHLFSFSGNPDLYVKFSGNTCENACTGVTLASANYKVLARTWENNYNVSDYKPHFKAYVSAQLVNVTGDSTTYDVIFDTEDFDPTGLFNNANGRATAPVSGKFKINTSLDVSGIAGMTDMTLQVRRTGSSTITDFINRSAASVALAGGTWSPQGYSEIDVVAADEVRVQLRITGGALVADVDSNDKFSYFSAEFIPD